MNQKLTNWVFWLSLIAIVLSLAIILLWITGSIGISIVSSDNFVGVSVALLTIIVTLLVGWQIYNAIEIKEKINTINSLESKLANQAHELEQKFNKSNHNLSYIAAQLAIDRENYIDAYRWLINSLQYSVLLDRPRNIDLIINELTQCVALINKNSPIEIMLMEEIESSHNTIIHTPMFDSFRFYYMPIYKEFKDKIKVIE